MKSVFTKMAVAFGFTMLGSAVNAQQTATDSSERYEKKAFRTWSVGLNGGMLTHYTPFNNKSNGDYRTPQEKWGYGGYIKKQILPGFGIQADFLAGKVEGKRANSLPANSAAQDNSSFETRIDWAGSVSANLTVGNFSLNNKRSVLSPYITAGAGYMSSKAQVFNTPAGATTGYNENWFIPVGAGLKVNLGKAVNLDLGYRVGFMKANDFDGVVGATNDRFSYAHAGIEIALGNKKSSQLQNFSPVAALREANAAESAELRNQLARLEEQRMAKEQAYQQELGDDDRDGVANKFDKCAGTPSGTVVDGAGCPIAMPAPVIVNPVTEKVIVTAEDRRVLDDAIKDLEFDLGKSTLKESSNSALDKVAAVLMQKNFTLKLAGHTDNIGSAAANMKLSKERAESVKAYLVGKGANASRIEATGYGAAQPIESNKTAEGRQKNRRVEFTMF
ncbi:MAG: OmpA family protein [Chitinophagaceae bacterium]|nr:MAG: OmpA family protein [Chitinophagaceae bacterium]